MVRSLATPPERLDSVQAEGTHRSEGETRRAGGDLETGPKRCPGSVLSFGEISLLTPLTRSLYSWQHACYEYIDGSASGPAHLPQPPARTPIRADARDHPRGLDRTAGGRRPARLQHSAGRSPSRRVCTYRLPLLPHQRRAPGRG